MYVSLDRTFEFQEIEATYAHETFEKAIRLCREYELASERAVALMFDIKVQNGGVVHGIEYDIENPFGISLKPMGWQVMSASQTTFPPKK